MSLSTLNYVTSGLYPNFPNYGPLLAGGAPVTLNPTPHFNASEDPATPGLPATLNLSAQQILDLQSLSSIRQPDGSVVVPNRDGFVSVGEGYQLGFDPTTLQGRIQPALVPDSLSGQIDLFGNTGQTYTGADVRLMIESSEASPDGRRYAKQLLESTTITVSVHREVAPVRAGGYINPKGFALGKRTIAGTLIVTQFTADILLDFLQSVMMNDVSKDTTFNKIDQLPPFNITLIFTNEQGYASQRRLLGVKFVTDGVVYSIQDMLVEQTISWMATDFTPLVPFTLENLYRPVNQLEKTTRRERTPSDVMAASVFV